MFELSIPALRGQSRRHVLILGRGGFGRQLADWLMESGVPKSRLLFLDDNAPGCAGPLADYLSPALLESCCAAYVALGDNRMRVAYLQKLADAGYALPVFAAAAEFAPSAAVSPSAELGFGTVVLPHAYVGAGVKTGAGCIINAGAIVDHDATLGQGVHIAPGAIVKAGASVPDFAKVDSGEIIPSPWQAAPAP